MFRVQIRGHHLPTNPAGAGRTGISVNGQRLDDVRRIEVVWLDLGDPAVADHEAFGGGERDGLGAGVGCSRYVQPGYGVLSVGQDVTDLVAGEVEVLREEADDALTVQLRQAPLPVPFAALATVTDGPVVVDDLKDLRADRVRTWNDLQVGLILGN